MIKVWTDKWSTLHFFFQFSQLNRWCSMALARVLEKHKTKIAALSKTLIEHQKLCLIKHIETIGERHKLVKLIEKKICSEKSRLICVGSMVTKLSCHNNSDIDLAFIVDNVAFWKSFLKNEEFKIYFMETVIQIFGLFGKDNPDLMLAEPPFMLPHLHVPLIVVKFVNGIAIDLQFPRHSWHAIRNTFLVKNYVMADERFSQLYFYVRAIFTALGLKNSREGLYSSYHIICFVIHFLHKLDGRESSIMPILYKTHPNLFSHNLSKDKLMWSLYSDENMLNWKSQNKQSVGELAVEFFHYYATAFDPINQCINIANGELENRCRPNDGRSLRLMIMDPYSKFTVCRSDILTQVTRPAFNFIWNAIQRDGQFLDAFPDFPEEAKNFHTKFSKERWGPCLNKAGTIDRGNVLDDEMEINAK